MRICLFALACLASALEAAAITGGAVTLTGGAVSATGSFSLRGGDFEVTGVGSDGFSNILYCQGLCADDARLLTSGLLGEMRNGTAVLPGVPQSTLAWQGLFRFFGPVVQLAGPGDYSAPFTMTGNLCAFQGFSLPCRFELPLTGQGVVYFTATRSPTTGGLSTRTAEYVFTPEAIPEPSATALLVLGAATVTLRAWRTRRVTK
jgi:hypothetical protein